MNEVLVNYNEKDLLIYFQQVRLLKSKEANERNVERTKDVKEEKTTFKGAMNNFGHFFERNFRNFDGLTKSINESIEKFNKKHSEVISKEAAESAIKILFEKDKYGSAKLFFAASIVIDDEYKYEYVNEGLEEVSLALFDKKETLPEIKKQIEENYNAIGSKSIQSIEANVLLALTVAWFGVLLPFAPLVAAVPIAVVAITQHDVLSGNKDRIKEEFKKSSSEKNAFYLALQCTYIQRLKKNTSIKEDEFKEELDSILKSINELKSDLDYYLFVENESTKDNIAKNKAFHKFDERLVKVLELEK